MCRFNPDPRVSSVAFQKNINVEGESAASVRCPLPRGRRCHYSYLLSCSHIQVSHGSGPTLESSHNAAAERALAAFGDSGVDCSSSGRSAKSSNSSSSTASSSSMAEVASVTSSVKVKQPPQTTAAAETSGDAAANEGSGRTLVSINAKKKQKSKAVVEEKTVK